MQNGYIILPLLDGICREATLFAALWFLVGGLGDLLVDLLYFADRVGYRVRAALLGERAGPVASDLPSGDGAMPGQAMAVFIPAWDESGVIGAMARATLSRLAYPDYRLYIGAYPNDPATIAAVLDVAQTDARVRLVLCPHPGPTTKADCLNALWRALLRDETAEGKRFAGVLLHDAEDVVHPLELRVVAQWLCRHAAVQLPVLPLPHPRSRFVSGHYCDEFAESHGKQLVVRQMLGAGVPFAGVGCAIRRDVLARIADARGGAPFDAASLTEDYELGLTISAIGESVRFVRVAEAPGGPLVAVRAYFPADLSAAVRQKARWMTGIALAGWDRIGWSRAGDVADNWMRLRDRKAVLAMLVLAIAYCALVAWPVSIALHLALAVPMPVAPEWMIWLVAGNMALLAWRMGLRCVFVGRAYGWREALWSLPRVVVANAIALMAARRAVLLYVRMLATGTVRWDKTRHEFPEPADARGAGARGAP